METILWIIGGAAVLFGLGAFIFSESSNPKDRATEAAGAAAGGAAVAFGCLLQLIIPALMLLAGLWLLGKIFG
jgi:hypothetical protein